MCSPLIVQANDVTPADLFPLALCTEIGTTNESGELHELKLVYVVMCEPTQSVRLLQCLTCAADPPRRTNPFHQGFDPVKRWRFGDAPSAVTAGTFRPHRSIRAMAFKESQRVDLQSLWSMEIWKLQPDN